MEGFLTRCGYAISILVIVLTLLVVTSSTATGQMNVGSQNIFLSDSKPYGLTYGEWSAKWWQWALSIPKGESPLIDETGKNCVVGQTGPVWFLAGTTGGSAARTCAIPAGKGVLFPAFNVECSYAENPDLKTDSQLSACAKSQMDVAKNIVTTVDGQSIPSLNGYRVQSPAFNVTFPADNIFGVSPQNSRSVSDGVWIMLKPLTAGDHEVKFGGLALDVTTTSTSTFATDVTYKLTVR